MEHDISLRSLFMAIAFSMAAELSIVAGGIASIDALIDTDQAQGNPAHSLNILQK